MCIQDTHSPRENFHYAVDIPNFPDLWTGSCCGGFQPLAVDCGHRPRSLVMIPRLRLQIARSAPVIVVVLVLVGAVTIAGAWYTQEHPSTESVTTSVVDEARFTASLNDAIIIQNASGLYRTGARLENHPVYFTEVSDTLQLSAAITPPPNRTSNLSYQLVLRSYAERDEAVVWEEYTDLASGSARLEGEPIVVNTSLNLSVLQSRLAGVEQIVGGVATTHTELRFVFDYDAQPAADGDAYAGQVRLIRELRIVSNAYWVTGDPTASVTEQTHTTVQPTPAEPEMAMVAGMGAAGGSAWLLALGVAVYRRRLPPVERLALEVERRTLESWVSEGTFIWESDVRYVSVRSLRDLVDIAIDSNRRVLHDPEQDVYTVAIERRVYILESAPGD